jgi:hypothetical protein
MNPYSTVSENTIFHTPKEVPTILKFYGGLFIGYSILQLISLLAPILVFENYLHIIQIFIVSMIPLYIGYGILTGKKLAYTILFFVTFFYSAAAIILFMASPHNLHLVYVLAIQVLVLFSPPLWIVRNYWNQMEPV